MKHLPEKFQIEFGRLPNHNVPAVFDFHDLIAARQLTNHGKQKGRELNAPPVEAPRSALHENDIKPRPGGRVLDAGLVQMKIRGFLLRPAAEATQKVV